MHKELITVSAESYADLHRAWMLSEYNRFNDWLIEHHGVIYSGAKTTVRGLPRQFSVINPKLALIFRLKYA